MNPVRERLKDRTKDGEVDLEKMRREVRSMGMIDEFLLLTAALTRA